MSRQELLRSTLDSDEELDESFFEPTFLEPSPVEEMVLNESDVASNSTGSEAEVISSS